MSGTAKEKKEGEEMSERIITYQQLVDAGACEGMLDIFRDFFGDSVSYADALAALSGPTGKTIAVPEWLSWFRKHFPAEEAIRFDGVLEVGDEIGVRRGTPCCNLFTRKAHPTMSRYWVVADLTKNGTICNLKNIPTSRDFYFTNAALLTGIITVKRGGCQIWPAPKRPFLEGDEVIRVRNGSSPPPREVITGTTWTGEYWQVSTETWVAAPASDFEFAPPIVRSEPKFSVGDELQSTSGISRGSVVTQKWNPTTKHWEYKCDQPGGLWWREDGLELAPKWSVGQRVHRHRTDNKPGHAWGGVVVEVDMRRDCPYRIRPDNCAPEWFKDEGQFTAIEESESPIFSAEYVKTLREESARRRLAWRVMKDERDAARARAKDAEAECKHLKDAYRVIGGQAETTIPVSKPQPAYVPKWGELVEDEKYGVGQVCSACLDDEVSVHFLRDANQLYVPIGELKSYVGPNNREIAHVAASVTNTVVGCYERKGAEAIRGTWMLIPKEKP